LMPRAGASASAIISSRQSRDEHADRATKSCILIAGIVRGIHTFAERSLY